MNARARRTHAAPVNRQRGLTLFGLVFYAIVFGFIGYLAIRIFPTLNEYYTIQRTINRIASTAPATVSEARLAFEKQKAVEYAIESISGKDLDITKENDKVVIRFAYNKEVPIIPPVYVLMKYEGRSQ